MTHIFLAFIEGVGLVLSPCILPVLPIILTAGLAGGKNRPYGIIAGFIFTFCVFTLLSRQLVLLTGIDLDVIRIVGYYLLFFLGLVLIIDPLSRAFDRLTSSAAVLGDKLSNRGNQKSGLWGGFLIGSALGLIWTPCSGPILAVVLVQVIQGMSTFESIVIVFSFAVGVAVPMLALTLLGRRFFNKLGFLLTHGQAIRRIIGGIIILTVILTGGREMIGLTQEPTTALTAAQAPETDLQGAELLRGLREPYPAPSIDGVGPWFNSDALSLDKLKGKVVLIDFWTYSCINCIRTLPYLTHWDRKYRKEGLVIIGIHSPEFEFEKKGSNVENALRQHYIQYAVAQDNNFIGWKAFKNTFWPAHYLIDKTGKVVYVHYGEGHYDITENNIRFLLGLGKMTEHEMIPMGASLLQSPETYLGKARAHDFSGSESMMSDVVKTFHYPKSIPLHHWALSGSWLPTNEYMEAQEKGAALKIHFSGKRVFLVLSPRDATEIRAKIRLNGQEISHEGGKDTQGGILTVSKDSLYELISLPTLTQGELEIIALNPGLRAYVFTFGS